MITIINRRLDKLRLLRTYPDKYLGWNASLSVAKDFAKGGDLKQITKKYHTIFWKPYEGQDESTALRIVFGGSKNGYTASESLAPVRTTEVAFRGDKYRVKRGAFTTGHIFTASFYVSLSLKRLQASIDLVFDQQRCSTVLLIQEGDF